MIRTARRIRQALRQRPGVLEHEYLHNGKPARLVVCADGRNGIEVAFAQDVQVLAGDRLQIAIADARTIALEAGVFDETLLAADEPDIDPTNMELQETLDRVRDELRAEREVAATERDVHGTTARLLQRERVRASALDASLVEARQAHEQTIERLRLAEAACRRKRNALRDLGAAYQHRVDEADRAAEAALSARNGLATAVQNGIDGCLAGTVHNLRDFADKIERDFLNDHASPGAAQALRQAADQHEAKIVGIGARQLVDLPPEQADRITRQYGRVTVPIKLDFSAFDKANPGLREALATSPLTGPHLRDVARAMTANMPTTESVSRAFKKALEENAKLAQFTPSSRALAQALDIEREKAKLLTPHAPSLADAAAQVVQEAATSYADHDEPTDDLSDEHRSARWSGKA